METLSIIALILLSLAGYSAGAVSGAKGIPELKPRLFDLILVSTIWAGAVYSRAAFGFNKWLLILLWIIVAALIGTLAAACRNFPGRSGPKVEDTERLHPGGVRAFGRNWMSFSRKAGAFQSRIILSLLFFVLVSPFALAVKIFSDPLRIKPGGSKSYWLPRKENRVKPEQFRRQF